MCLLRVIRLVALLACADLVSAQGAATTADPAASSSSPGFATAQPLSDASNYLSDRISFQFPISVKVVDTASNDEEKPLTFACAPRYTEFRGVGRFKVDGKDFPAFIVVSVSEKAAAAAGILATPDPDETPDMTAADKKKQQAEQRAKDRAIAKEQLLRSGCPEKKLIVKVNDIVLIGTAELAATPPDRTGLTFGTLLVPYKRQIKGDSALAGKASLGGYLGWRQDRSKFGVGLQWVFFGGVSSIEVAQTVNGTATTQSLMGLSYGIALLGTVKNDFHLGFVVGSDRVNKSAGYVYNDKPWIALSIGFAFSN